VLATAAAFSYGITIVLNRSLAQADLGVTTVLGVRFATAAGILFVAMAALRRPVLPAPGERLRVILLGGVGYMIESTLFFMGLERGTAAAVALLFYAYPALVTLIELVLGWTDFHGRTMVALVLSAVGTVLVVVSGGQVSISTTGIIAALGSAASFAVYFVVSGRIIRRTDAMTTAAWVAGGAAASFFLRGLLLGELRSPVGHLPALFGNGLATASAFVLMFAALRQLGASRTSVVMTLEAVFGILLAAVFLGEGIRPLQAVGGLAVLGATALIALARRTPIEV
jgi:drug/metabolite transporter (DMT)-like permease